MSGYSKRLIVCFSFCCVLAVCQNSSSAEKTIRLLTVGNSFATNATEFLPRIVKSVPDCELLLGKANIGGAPLDKHYRFAIQSETDEKVKPYWFRKPGVKGKAHKVNLKEALTAEKWDVVTMQQYSAYSFKREKFIPHFDNLFNYIKKYAPQAKIYVHQTWAYRADEPRFKPGRHFTQEEMYRLLTENYIFFAKKNKCKLLPSGAAFQLCREKQPVAFSFPDPKFNYKKPEPGALPDQRGSLNVGWRWRKGQFRLDAHHANKRGCYLAACVWFEVLYGIDAR